MKTVRLIMSFVRSSLEDACALAQDILASRGIATNWQVLPGGASLGAIRDQLPPPDAPPSGLFFVSPECKEWTGFLSRMDDGWYTLVNAMSRHASRPEAIYVCVDLEPTSYPSTAFEVFGGGHSVRRVHAWKDEDGWHFIDRGKPLSIEDTSVYSRRLIAQRLDLSILEGLLARLDISLAGLQTASLTRTRLLTT